MRIPIYQIDAFTQRRFAGNPAAVCPLERWLPDGLMQDIANENNLSETAFFVPEGDGYRLRWFTPECEVDLCGHATLASGYVIAHMLAPGTRRIRFESRSGTLWVETESDRLRLDFPSAPPESIDLREPMSHALRVVAGEVLASPSMYLVPVQSEEAVRAVTPDMAALAVLGRVGVIVTAPGRDCDFVSRFFAPAAAVPEDPVTGSAHCVLAPYWAKRLGRTRLHARQVSRRGGELFCELRDGRVLIAGQAVKYLEGFIEV